jgi:hypothetical protein
MHACQCRQAGRQSPVPKELRHQTSDQNISALEVGWIQGPVAQWLEYLAYIWGSGVSLGSNPGMVTFFCHTRTARAETTRGFPIQLPV